MIIFDAIMMMRKLIRYLFIFGIVKKEMERVWMNLD